MPRRPVPTRAPSVRRCIIYKKTFSTPPRSIGTVSYTHLASAVIAGALGATSLILMTDTKGVLRNKDDESSLIEKIYVSDIPSLVKQGIISGGMIPKIDCCREAIRRGVKKVFIIDGRVEHSILVETLSDQGIGTMFVNGD